MVRHGMIYITGPADQATSPKPGGCEIDPATSNATLMHAGASNCFVDIRRRAVPNKNDINLGCVAPQLAACP